MEDTARAVGSGSPLIVTIAGKECQPRPLSLKELGELERASIQSYVDSVLENFQVMVKYLPEARREEAMLDKVNEMSRLTLQDLPSKFVHDPKKLKVNKELREWVEINMDGYLPDDINPDPMSAKYLEAISKIVTIGLDTGLIKEEFYTSLTKDVLKKTKVGFANWWQGSTYDGRLMSIWLCFKTHGVTRDQVAEALGKNPKLMVAIAAEIDKLSAPSVGNG